MNKRMNPEIKARWLAALRSGEYLQGFGQLKSEPDVENDTLCFCCLGVLADIYIKEKDKRWDTKSATGDEILPYDSVLSERVVGWAGLNHHDPELVVGNDTDCISYYNDMRKLSFEQLANLIEKQL